MPKLVTVKQFEDQSERAKDYVKAYILFPSGILGLISMVGGTGALGYQLIATGSYTWATFWISSALLLISGGAVYWAVRGIRAGSNRRLAIGLGIAFLLGAVALGIQIFDYTQLNFRWDTNAYGSVFYLLGIYALSVLSGGLLINGLTQFWAWRGQYTARRHVMAENTLLYWFSSIGLWLVSFGVIYLAPYFI